MTRRRDCQQELNALESRLEERIFARLNAVIDDKVAEKISTVRDDLNASMDEIRDEIDSLKESGAISREHDDCSLNVVIRNLKEGANEMVDRKVDALFREGLKIGTKVARAERKNSYNSRPGIIIAKLRNSEDKKTVMISKHRLRDSREYSGVSIKHDKPKHERVMESNFMTIVNNIPGARDHVSFRGGRVVSTNTLNGTRQSRHQDNSSDSDSMEWNTVVADRRGRGYTSSGTDRAMPNNGRQGRQNSNRVIRNDSHRQNRGRNSAQRRI